MANDKRYNGWTNYETWNVALWMDNEEGSERAMRRMASDAYMEASADSTFTRKERAVLDLADTLKSEYEEANPLADQANVWSDLLSAALSEVNWYEIAEHKIADVADDIDAEETEEEDTEEESAR